MKKILLTGLALLSLTTVTKAEEWIVNSAKTQPISWSGTSTDLFLKKSDTSQKGQPAAGDIVYLNGDQVKANSSIPKVDIIMTAGATLDATGGFIIGNLSLDNSKLTSSGSGTGSSRSITVDAISFTGNNEIEINKGSTSATSYLFNIGAAGSGGANPMKITGSGTITKTGDSQLCVRPNSDLINNTTFSGKWVISTGEVISKNGSGSEKRCEFLPGTAVEIAPGAKYTITKMYLDNGFVDGNLSGQTIIVKSGGTLDVFPTMNNNIGISQGITVETGGIFNVNSTTGTGTTPTVTIEGDLILNPGSKYNVFYGSVSGEIFTLKNTTIKVTATTVALAPPFGIVAPLVNWNGNPMPEYTGKITVDVNFVGTTSVDFTPLFTPLVIPSTYTNDIPVITNAAAGTQYTVKLPQYPAKGEGGESWILYENGDQKIDLSASAKDYVFTGPQDIVFKWAVWTGPTSINNTNIDKAVISTKYFTVTGIQVKEPQRGGVYIQQDTYEDGSVNTSKVLK